MGKQNRRLKSLSQAQFDTIQTIAQEQSGRVYSYMTSDDLENEIWNICLTALPEFKKSLGINLENFLRSAVKNRLVNKFKQVTKSVKIPCLRCPFYNPGKSPGDCKKYGSNNKIYFDYGRTRCDKWVKYKQSTDSRNSLMNTAEPRPEYNSIYRSQLDKLVTDETVKLLMSSLPKRIAEDFSNYMAGISLAKHKFNRMQKCIVSVLSAKGAI